MACNYGCSAPFHKVLNTALTGLFSLSTLQLPGARNWSNKYLSILILLELPVGEKGPFILFKSN